MIQVPRMAMVLTAYLFGLFHAGLGIYWSGHYQDQRVGFAAVAIYLGALTVTLFLTKGFNIPPILGLSNLLAATVIPRMVEEQLHPHLYGTYAVWYVGALGVLLGATALRGQPYYAWGGLVIAVTEILLWEGPENIMGSGVVGLVLLVVIGNAANLGIRQSEQAIEKYNRESAEALVAAKRTEIVRATQAKTFGRSVPSIQEMLRKVIAQKGKLSYEDRQEALLLENELSDDVMGGDLLSKEVSRAARAARLRGVEVYLIDQGVLANVSKPEVDEIHQKIEDVISEQQSGKVTVRATSGNKWLVSITAFERGSNVPNVDWKF